MTLTGDSNTTNRNPREKNRNLHDLFPPMRANVEAYLAAVHAAFPHITMMVDDGRRSRERQAYLYSLNSRDRWVTNCDGTRAHSMHQYGLAVDLFFVRNATPGRAVYDHRSWRTIYAHVPPGQYGLELIPQELCHVQLKGSQAQVETSGRLNRGYVDMLGLKFT